MTRDEFINGHVARVNQVWGKEVATRTDDGYQLANRRRHAVLCVCNEADCPGWLMVVIDDMKVTTA